LQINPTKSFWGKDECECPGFIVNRCSMKPQPKKTEAIRQLQPPKNCKQLHRLIGMCDFCRDLHPKQSHMMSALTKISSKMVRCKWGEEQQKAFEELKRVFCKEVLLSYPNFNKPFDIHTDASDYQLGSVISQDGKPIAFYSRKLSNAQKNYTVAEKELLSIVETFKEFRTILLGQQLNAHADHQNLLCKAHANQRATRWRLLIEEHGPNLICLPGKKNVVADALSRLDKTNDNEPTTELNEGESLEKIFPQQAEDFLHMQPFAQFLSGAPKETFEFEAEHCSDKCLAECFASEPTQAEDECFPSECPLIQKEQQKDKDIHAKLSKKVHLNKPF